MSIFSRLSDIVHSNINTLLEKAIEQEAARHLEVESKLAELLEIQESYHEAQAKLQQIEGQRALDQQELARLEKQERPGEALGRKGAGFGGSVKEEHA